MNWKLLLFVMSTLSLNSFAYSGPVDHCYHWLKEGSGGILTHKYNHAKEKHGELTFYGSNGNGGPGLYCAKEIWQSISYGDRVVRVNFVDDVVLYDVESMNIYCGKDSPAISLPLTINFQLKSYDSNNPCKRPIDVIRYAHGYDFYVIKNEASVKTWSANDGQVVKDLEKIAQVSPSENLRAEMTLKLIQKERSTMGTKRFVNGNRRKTKNENIDDYDNFTLKITSALYNKEDITEKLQKSCEVNSFCEFNIRDLAKKPGKKDQTDEAVLQFECQSASKKFPISYDIRDQAYLARVTADCEAENKISHRTASLIKIKSARFVSSRSSREEVSTTNLKKVISKACDGQETCTFTGHKNLSYRVRNNIDYLSVQYECSPDLKGQGLKTGDADIDYQLDDLKLSCK